MSKESDELNVLLAQLDATKQMYNESVNACLNLRTQFVLLQKKVVSLEEELRASKEKNLQSIPKNNVNVPSKEKSSCL